MVLNLLFCISSIAWSCGICFGTGIHPLWLLLLIPAIFVGNVLIYLLSILLISLCFPKQAPKKSSAFCRLNIRLFLDWLMSVLRARVRLSGEEMLPDEPCVIVCNHRSAFDPMAYLAKTKRKKLLFLSKEGNFKIPIAGPFIRRAGFMAIDRENGMRALRTLKAAADCMKAENADFGVYPEGTRSKTGELLEFKPGAFYLAQKAKSPIAVMAAIGTEKIGKHFPIHPVRAELRVLAVIDRETVCSSSMEELADMTRSMIERALKEA